MREEKLDFNKWDLSYLDKEILKYIQNGINTAPEIRNEFLKKEQTITLQALEYHLIDLSEKKLIIKTSGKPHKYNLNTEIL